MSRGQCAAATSCWVDAWSFIISNHKDMIMNTSIYEKSNNQKCPRGRGLERYLKLR